MREIFGSHPGAFLQHKFVPKHGDERHVGKKPLKHLFVTVCCNTHCQCSFVLVCGGGVYVFVKMMSSPMLISEINNLNGLTKSCHAVFSLQTDAIQTLSLV